MATISDGIRKPGRPRSAQADQRILSATLEALVDVGYEALSIEAIAARAGVGKTTIYRRWSSKDDLIIAATDTIRVHVPVPNTGNLRNDLLALARGALEVGVTYPEIQKLFTRTLSEVKARPEVFQVLVGRLIQPRIQGFIELVERAKARGEVRRNLDTSIVLSIIMGPVIYDWVVGSIVEGKQFAPDLAEQIVDGILNGITPR
ncbi:MAG TPA: TetR/AcrR family transcriptional regulator [Ktedonobacterales bacterium]|nr:TetR/AcrR family transcriptional regulator [Ktedonobacterales bacterium]